MIHNALTRWAARRLHARLTRTVIQHRHPDFAIGGENSPYLLRWYLIPRNRFLNVYLHVFLRGDDDRALHDHPWWSASLTLDGAASEVYWHEGRSPIDGLATIAWRPVRVGDVVLRSACFAHRIVLDGPAPYTTLFITGPRVRAWGFWCQRGWRHWKVFTGYADTGDSTKIGRGCE